MPIRQSLGQRIAQARRELAVRLRRDLTQADIAKMVGTTAATMSRWESDVAVPKEDALAKLAKALEVTPAFLRYGVGQPASAGSPLDRIEELPSEDIPVRRQKKSG